MKGLRLIFAVLIFLSIKAALLWGDERFSWDFSDCPVRDVLFAVSLDSGVSIICDDTVSGKCDLKFYGDDFEKGFDAFLKSCRLYVEKNEGVWTVSKIRFGLENGKCYLDVLDVTPERILEKLSGKISSVLTFDSLPSAPVSLHLKGLEEKELMESLAKIFGGCQLVQNELGFHFGKRSDSRKMDFSEGYVRIFRNEELGFEFDVKDGKFSEVLEKLFELADEKDRSFCLPGGVDFKVSRAVFTGKDMADSLEKICRQNGFKYVLADGIYYILSDSESKNELIEGKRHWESFYLKYIKPENFLSLLGKQLGKMESFVLANQNAVCVYATENEKTQIEELLAKADENQSTYLVNLKFMKPEEMLNHLPPGIDKNKLSVADDNSCLYFTGTEAGYQALCSQIGVCDQPVKRLSYDLLILQYDETNQNDWNPSLSAERIALGDRNGISGVLGSVASLNMNVVGAFGLNFALSLQGSIEENMTKVFADTTLHGISGKKINFQNTNTYRYRDNNLDPETGKPVYSGITREISSGIKIEVQGWVSGDGMITSTVTASITRQGTDTSSTTGNPPPTSEKIVTTEVRGKSGEPVVLSGLFERADSEDVKRTPFISRIPLLGRLFTGKSKNKELNQMVIYLIPHVDEEKSAVEEKKAESEWMEERFNFLEWSAGE